MEIKVMLLIAVKVIYCIVLVLTWFSVLNKNSPIKIFTHQLFFFSYAVFMLWIFRPRGQPYVVDKEVKILLFIFAIVTLLNLEWKEWFNSMKNMLQISQQTHHKHNEY